MTIKYLLGKFTFLFLVLVLIISCSQNTEFTVDELSWIDVYKENDVLIFKNLISKELDTLFIVKKEVYHPDYDWFRHSEYIPHTAHLFYENKKYKKLDHPAELLEIYKRKPDKEARPLIKYLGSTFFTEEFTLVFSEVTLETIQKSFDEVYTFRNAKQKNHRKGQDANPQVLFWDKEYGIIKYVTYEGDIWERVNW
ncbi:hypothetical protein WIW50_10125 [Flavobacteriaceae bacterium 3-367]